MDEATIKKMRGRSKSALTRTINAFSEQLSKAELLLHFDRLDAIFKDFDQYDALLTEEQSEIVEFENKFFEIKLKYQNAIEALNVPPISIQNSTFASVSSNNSTFKLPRLNIPMFSGKYTDWLNFKDLYLATVHSQNSLAKVQKFQYLIGLLAEEPASIIKHIPISETTYDEAWNKLLSRYDNKNQIVRSLIKTFLDQPSITEVNCVNLRCLADTSDEVIRALKSIGEEASSRDVWLIYLLLQKLDSETRQLWSVKVTDDEFPSIESFLDFLNSRCVSLEIFCSNENERKIDVRNRNAHQKNMLVSKNKVMKCIYCNGMHNLSKCYKFKSLDITNRKDVVRKHLLCFNCFGSHQVKNCFSQVTCNICRNKHNTLLHEDFKTNKNLVSNSSLVNEQSKKDDQTVSVSCNTVQGQNISILPTAKVVIYDSSGESHECTVLLDSASEASFIAESFVNKLRLNRKNARISVKGIGSVNADVTRGLVNINIASIYESHKNCINVDALILKKLTSNLPSEPIDLKDLKYLNTIKLADPNFSVPKQIDLIIGADYFFSLLLPGQIMKSCHEPIAQNTIFGWVVSGKMKIRQIDSQPINAFRVSLENENNIDSTLKRFWELEEIPSQRSFLSEEEEYCETHFQKTHRINEDGRFVVKLPILNDTNNLGDSKSLAVSRFLSIERKFVKDKILEEHYKNFMSEYLNLGHMTRVENNDHSSNIDRIYYLPHHAIIKPESSSTKLRVVFDGSCRTKNSESLNSILAVGPTIQRDIFSILICFRMHKIAFSADIEKMYRQILVDTEDQNFQRIVWRDSNDAKLQDYKLCTVTYGTASAPFLATRCLQQIALHCKTEYPHIASIIKNEFYVDDCLSGSNNLKDTIQITSELSEILKKHGFHLRKWRSNSESLLHHLTCKDEEMDDLEIQIDDCAKTLGLLWDSNKDYFKFKVSLEFPEEITKRIFLSQSSKLFDPLGFLSPSVIMIKIFYQQLWLIKLDWDSPLPEEWKNKLLKFQDEFKALEEIQIPRWLHTTSKSIQLHGFCDASEMAFCAVIYCLTTDREVRQVNIMVAKTKVAPIKQISICRLELLGALLLSRLYAAVRKALLNYDICFHAWTDSKVVLSWLATHPRKWKLFIANRTSEILDIIPYEQWSHVPSKQNPADLASRGINPKTLSSSSLWWHGPSFLLLDKSNWPDQCEIELSTDNNVLNELKSNSAFNATTCVSNDIFHILFENVSSLSKIVNIISYCLKFIFRCRERVNTDNLDLDSIHMLPFLSTKERENALMKIILYVQSLYFKVDVEKLKNKNFVASKSSIGSLCPFLDDKGILRVGGRLQNSQLSFNAKHPIILPGKHKISNLIVKQFHITHLHAGPSLLANILKQNYWIIKGNNVIQSIVRNCIRCHRYKLTGNNQLMGNLPPERVTLVRPFFSCGCDYAGPIMLKLNKGRGIKTTKGYIALFVCLATKAYHIEAVSELTADAFIAAFRRFVSRRGTPKYLFSDNGTNFVGAKRKLSELHAFLSSIHSNEFILNYLSQTKIEWKMIPPSSPHFGGIWESGIKSVKFHLKRITKEKILTFEELSTLLAQIEAVLNSRPLSRTSHSDVSNLHALTPSHFLIGDVISSIPEVDFSNTKISLLKRWELLQQMKQSFWKRYYKEYLHSLQQRYKWKNNLRNLVVGDVVLIKEENIPPGVWPLGLVSKVHPGSDGIVRVVTVKTANGYFKKPIVKLTPLPLYQE